MEKLLVNKETFKALTEAIERNGEDGLMELHTEAPTGWAVGWHSLNSLTIPQMAKAIYVGYELMQTPEQHIKTYYDAYKGLADSGDYDTAPEGKARCEAVIFTLNMLGKEIEGVNK
jgi:hypothetical protein